jgi:NADH-quinone oxidoreductase subunit G
MIEIELNGKKVEVPAGSMVMHAASKAGVYIPHFCYHKKLSIAANCRMCLVDVEKAPKPLPACATPVSKGMVVHTHSQRAIKAQKSVMEFLLINHPLDCPICDQGGECQLQDLAVGYGAPASRYTEEKRVVTAKDVGSLISMEEMSRCIQCTRCVRFGQEIAGVMEFGMTHRGEHSEIETFVGQTVDSELSGNMIDICPVGALTSKPFRYQARTWELSRRRSVSPHDSTGTNLVIQVKNNKVMRVVPFENEAINECWIADRDRFSYEALNSKDRLERPMLKQNNKWLEVDWNTALQYVVDGLKDTQNNHGAENIAALVSPHSTVEEAYLCSQLIRGLGSDNIDHRLRYQDFRGQANHWLGLNISTLSHLKSVLVMGSHLRKDHPLFAQRIRQAVRKGAILSQINEDINDWAIPVTHNLQSQSTVWLQTLINIATAVAQEKGVAPPIIGGQVEEKVLAIAKSLSQSKSTAVLLGNAVAHHEQAEELLAIAHWIATQCGASIGYLTEAANTIGVAMVGARPLNNGLHAKEILSGKAKTVVLLNNEPVFDSAYGESGLLKSNMVISLSPFRANMDIADVLLPITPFSETSGAFVNAEGRLQCFYGVVKPLGEARPAWKVLRVLGTMLGLPDFSFDTSESVLQSALGTIEKETFLQERLSNISSVDLKHIQVKEASKKPVTASIYHLDSLVRRSPALQATKDAQKVIA